METCGKIIYVLFASVHWRSFKVSEFGRERFHGIVRIQKTIHIKNCYLQVLRMNDHITNKSFARFGHGSHGTKSPLLG